MKIYKGIAVALTAVILASGGGITSSLVTAQPAQAAASQPEIDSAIAQILAETNAERVKAGLKPLTLNSQMSSVSQTWTQRMAAEHTMYHNPGYTNQLPKPWLRVGENVGQGYTQSTIVPAWMASEGHRSNILGSFTHIGIGYWVDETGRGWFTQNFGKYEQPVLTTLNEPVTTFGKFDIKSTWLAKWDEIPDDYNSELYSSTGALLQTKVTTTPEVTFTGLTDNTAYTVKTTARKYNALAEVFSSPATTYTVTTIEDLPTVTAPTNLALKAGENSIEAVWAEPTDIYGTLAPYTVELLKDNTVVKTVQTTDLNYVFNELTSNTDYTVNVIAASKLKGKTATATATQVQKTMLSSVADVTEPKNLLVTADSATSVKASWEVPDQRIGVELKYLLTLSSAGKPDITATATSTNYTFTGVPSETAYTVKVKAFIASENGNTEITTAGVTGSATTPINYDGASASAPTLKPVVPEATKATLNWTAPTNIVGKLVDYTLTVKQQGQPDRVFKTALNSYTVTGLTENTAYTFQVEANITSLNGKNFGFSTPVTSTNTTQYAPSTAIVSAPRNLAVTAVNYHQINASWAPPANVVGTVIGYKVTVRSFDFILETKTVTGLNTSFTNLPDSGYYTVEVSAIATSSDKTKTVTSSLIENSDSTPAHVDAPNTPADFRVTSSAYNEANLMWGIPEVYGMVWDYTVTLKEAGKADRVFTTNRNSFLLTGLTENSSYTATVVANAVSRNGQLRDTSPVANLVFTTPYGPSAVKVNAPSDLKFSGVTHNALTASWVTPVGTIGSVTGYKVTLKKGTTVIETKTVTDLNTSFTGLENSTDYTVEVNALAASADTTKTAISSMISSKTLTLAYVAAPNSPTNLKTTAVAHNETSLSWVAPTGVVGSITDYAVTLKEAGKADRVFKTSGTSYEIIGLLEDTDYTVTVAANVVSKDGSKSITSPSSSVGVNTPYAPATVKVSPPTAVVISGVTYNSLNASWVAPVGTIGSLTGYKATLKSGTTVVETKTVTGLTASFTGLDDSTNYTVEITALATSPDKTRTATSAAATSAAKTPAFVDAPNAPTGLKATTVAFNEATLTWVAPTGVYGKIADYTVTLKQTGKADRVFKTAATTYKVTGLAENSDYTVQVAANAVSGDGSKSETSPLASVGVETPYSPDTVKVSAPAAARVTTNLHNSLTVSWTAPVGTVGKVTNYSVTLKQGETVKAIYSTTGTSYAFTGLNSNSPYTVEVRALAVSANGITKVTSAEAEITATTLKSPIVRVGAPTVRLSGVASDKVTVSWNKPPVTGSIASYKISVKTGTTTVKTIDVAALELSAVVTGLDELTDYSFTVEANAIAENEINTSKATSAAVNATTVRSAASTVSVSAPTALVATVTSGSVNATWTASAITGTLVNYTVVVKHNGTTVKTYTTTDTKATISGLNEKTPYTVEVTANAASSNGAYRATSAAATKSFTTELSSESTVSVSTPSTLTVSATAATATTGTVTAKWVKPATVGTLFQYSVVLKQNGVAVKSLTTTGSVTSATFTGLKERTAYTVEITAHAKSPNGKFSAISTATTKAITTPVGQDSVAAVATPSTLTLIPTFNTVKATWTKPATTGTLSQYRVILKLNGVEVKKIYLAGTVTNYTFTGLKEKTGYTVEIMAYAKSPNGKVEAISTTTKKNVTTTATPAASRVSVAPMAPLVASSPTKSTITASWTKPVITGTLTNYYVTIKQGTTTVKAYTTRSLKASFSGLKANTAYTITVKANVKSVDGLYSANTSVSKVVITKK